MSAKVKQNSSENSDIAVGEELKITVALSLKKLNNCEDKDGELTFPASLTSEERKYIHQVCQQYGLQSKSKGKGDSRCLTVYKKKGLLGIKKDARLSLSEGSCSLIYSFLQRAPLTHKEMQDVVPGSENDGVIHPSLRDLSMVRSLGRMVHGPPRVPPKPGSTDATVEARKLPVWNMRDHLLSAISKNQVILVRGETGSGKTTQVPQVILEWAHMNNMPCRIFCTQPRRISALSIAERVAAERNEKIGSIVGYQIRLESKTSNKTLLTFCTTGILLRTLMGGESALLNTVTHVIVDEVHERDRFTDFLLTVLRDSLPKFRHLKLILMSANLDAELYSRYFNNCPIIDVPGRNYPVKAFYLEDVLKYVKYSTRSMNKFMEQLQSKERCQGEASQWAQNVLNNLRAMPLHPPKTASNGDAPAQEVKPPPPDHNDNGDSSEPTNGFAVREDMDECIQLAFSDGDDAHFSQMMYLIMSENVSPDYQHSSTWTSPLMVSAARGRMDVVEQLLSMGASLTLKSANEWTCLDWAKSMGHENVFLYLQSYSACEGIDVGACNGTAKARQPEVKLSQEDKTLLEAYNLSTTNVKSCDTDLIYALCLRIHSSEPAGGILVFLPGYEDIVTLRDRIMTEDRTFNRRGGKYILFCLHSHMQSSDQKRVFKRTPVGVRKIILSTNIAETSVTINDVVYVIDCGKVKEMSFDSLSGVSCLRPVWVSQASAVQRRGRAGRCRPGFAYHLFSSAGFQLLQPHQTPEILRSPLQDLCLHTKLLAMPNTLIADFLSRAPEPPALLSVKNAVQLLKCMDALDTSENITELGHHLLDLNLPPHLGKMVVTATVLKCLDPVLTIATCLAFRDPFTLPEHLSDRKSGKKVKQKFADGSLSDHMVLLKAFECWQRVSCEQWQRGWCERNFISSATMEMVNGMRMQVLAQLRNSGFVKSQGAGDIRDVNRNSENWPVVKAAILSGAYPNIIRVQKQQKQLTTAKESKVRLHSSSVMMEFSEEATKEAKCRSLNASHKALIGSMPAEWLMFDEMVRIGSASYVKTVSVVSSLSVLLMSGPMRLPAEALTDLSKVDAFEADKRSDAEAGDPPEGMGPDAFASLLTLDEWIHFSSTLHNAHLALQLRHKLYALILRRLRGPSKPFAQGDEEVVRTVVEVLTEEEKVCGIPQPAFISQNEKNSCLDKFNELSVDESYSPPSSVQYNAAGGLVASHSYPNFSMQSPVGPAVLSNGFGLPTLAQMSSDSGAAFPAGFSGHVFNQFGSTPSVYGNDVFHNNFVSASNVRPGSNQVVAPFAAFHGGRRRVFVMRVANNRQLEASQSRGVWPLTSGLEKKLIQAAQNSCVIMVFAFARTNQMHGYARFWGQRANEVCPELTNAMSSPSVLYKIDWIKKWCVHFNQIKHLTNAYSDNQQLHLSRDGQELENGCGEQLLQIWEAGLECGETNGQAAAMEQQQQQRGHVNAGQMPASAEAYGGRATQARGGHGAALYRGSGFRGNFRR